MGILTSTVSKDIKRIEYMIKRYKEIKKNLPKGTISPKKIGNQTYHYLKYRDGNKIISDYIHKEDFDNLTEMIDHRKHCEIMIRSLKTELENAKKLLKQNK
ncbi:MAG: hypothetical protein K6E98_12350 [Lachnospiraceae bacterium]|nr:hypothetical protein [Lachnospiraceae bacterium]